MRTISNKGEATLIGALTSMGIRRDKFLTEDDQKKSMPDDEIVAATPDVLFKEPITLFGRQVFWIEAKNSLIIPEVSLQSKIDDLVAQVVKYNAAFGPGAILWTKMGFSESIQILLESSYSTLCLRNKVDPDLNKVSKNAKKNARNEEKRKQKYQNVPYSRQRPKPLDHFPFLSRGIRSASDFDYFSLHTLVMGSHGYVLGDASIDQDDGTPRCLGYTKEQVLASLNDAKESSEEATKLVKFELPDGKTVKIKMKLSATVADLYVEAFSQLVSPTLIGHIMLSRREDAKMVDLTELNMSLMELKVFNEVVKVKHVVA